MNDWITEYFKRDLTEAEEEELSGRLSSSPEETLRFARLMEEHYRTLGLPEPLWPGKPLPRPKGGFWKQLLPPVVLLLAVLLIYGFFIWRANAPYGVAPVVPPPASKAAKDGRKPLHHKPSPLPARPTPSPAPRAKPSVPPPTPRPFPRASALPHALPALSAARPAAPPAGRGRFYEELSINVELAEAGLATVKVLDGSGTTVRVIFAGLLPAGRRTFTWDGRTDSGSAAPAGIYTLQVQSGSGLMRRQVRLQTGGP